MDRFTLINAILSNLSDACFVELRDKLFKRYIPFNAPSAQEITPVFLSEKLCDYIEKVEISVESTFDNQIEYCVWVLDSIVSDRISKPQKSARKGAAHEIPRARRYYEKAKGMKKACLDMDVFLDYYRLMVCLYMASIRQESATVDDFDFSSGSLDLEQILSALEKEKPDRIAAAGKELRNKFRLEPEKTSLRQAVTKKARFNLEKPYSQDRCFFVIIILMFYYIKSKEINEEL